MRRAIWAMIGVAALAGCVAPDGAPVLVPGGGVPVAQTRPAPLADSAGFAAVVSRVEPLAESYCRSLARGGNCDFRIVIDDRPGQPPNAFQTLDSAGRPVLGFTKALIADARNADELAFVMGHEAAHHIAGHIPQQQQNAMAGALLAGVIAAAAGASPQDMDAVQQMGATMAVRSYSKEFELEADALGAEIAWRAGFDPMRGAAFFDRLPDPGDQFLGSHPANSQRKAIVARTVARLQSGG
jgi:predicted Zn-dependent protease